MLDYTNVCRFVINYLPSTRYRQLSPRMDIQFAKTIRGRFSYAPAFERDILNSLPTLGHSIETPRMFISFGFFIAFAYITHQYDVSMASSNVQMLMSEEIILFRRSYEQHSGHSVRF